MLRPAGLLHAVAALLARRARQGVLLVRAPRVRRQPRRVLVRADDRATALLMGTRMQHELGVLRLRRLFGGGHMRLVLI
jgi:hypothetical protein